MYSLDSADHAGGWSVDTSVLIPEWDQQGLERLVRYCARLPFSGEHLERLNEATRGARRRSSFLPIKELGR